MEKLFISRRNFLKGCALLGMTAAVGSSTALAGCSSSNGKTYIYTGCWKEKGGDAGLWMHVFDTKTGDMESQKQISSEISAGFIFIDAAKKLLYVTDEIDQQASSDIGEGGGGRIWVYKIDTSTGNLTELQRTNSFGSNPSMVTVDPTGNYIVVSIHTAPHQACQTTRTPDGVWHITPALPDASVVLFARNNDGTLGKVLDMYKFKGQHPSYLHSCLWAPSGKFFVVNDKGANKIYSMRIDTENNMLVSTARPVALGAGSSPRYVRFHPRKNWLYVNFEAANELDAYSYDDYGNLAPIGQAPVVPEQWKTSRVPAGGKFEQQDMKLNADGTVAYSVFRGSDDQLVGKTRVHNGGFQGVSVFAIDQNTGNVTNIQTLELDCAWPRGCDISPDGGYLVVSCLYSDEMITLTIGPDGTLVDTGIRTEQTTAANVTFFKPSN